MHKTLFFGIFFLLHQSLFCLNPETFVEDGKIIPELKTPMYLDIIQPFLPKNPVILEAGCNGGEDTVIMAQKWPLGHLHAFDPVPYFVSLTRNKVQAHRIKNTSVHPYALWHTTGKEVFHYSKTVGGASSLLESNKEMVNLCDYQDRDIVVDCINLDEWAKKNSVDHIDFMWLDMEGSELQVLSSAPNIVKSVRVIITEINFREFRVGMTQYKHLKKLLNDYGMTLYKIWGSSNWQGTALFVRSEILEKKKELKF